MKFATKLVAVTAVCVAAVSGSVLRPNNISLNYAGVATSNDNS